MPRSLASGRGIGHGNTEKGDEIAEGATQTTSIPLFTTWCKSCCDVRWPPIPGNKTATTSNQHPYLCSAAARPQGANFEIPAITAERHT